MTVASDNKRNSYSGDGSANTFVYSFRILNEDHLLVTLVASDGTETTQTKTTNYTVSGVGDEDGGNIVMVTPPASGETLVITRNMPFTQDTDYVESDKFPANAHEEALDELTMNDQQILETLDRALVVGVGQSVSTALPTPEANKALAWNGTATALVNTDVEAAAIETAKNDAEAAAAAAALSEANAATSETNAAASATSAATYGVSAQLYLANNYI